jgi:toxin ParE1/3/4
MAEVVLAPEAIADLVDIYRFICDREGAEQAQAVLSRLERKVKSLADLPLRGKLPEELAPFGNKRIREVQEAPWRLFYYLEGETVVVLNVLDGRRMLDELLQQRLLQ